MLCIVKYKRANLVRQCETNEIFSLLIKHILSLAFLKPREIPDVFNNVKNLFPVEAILFMV